MRRTQRRAAKDYIWTYSFNDVIKSENVARTDPVEVWGYINGKFGYVERGVVPCTFKGVVISDAYGNGALQQKEPYQR